ncbi:MAG: hypothetical protein AAB377_03615 [Patescibacteria group bacterium]
MNKNNKNLVLVGFLVVIVGLGGIWTFIKYRSTVSSPVADLGLVSYINAQGQEWSIPKGEYSFSVSGADKFPKFVTGFIDPLDVKVGDTQKMLVAINSDVELKRVWAEIETDNTVKMVELKMESSAPVSTLEEKPSAYSVDKNGFLVINDLVVENKNLVGNLIEKIQAVDGVVQYRYRGEWVVEDTHTRTYHTRFVVEDSKGRLDSMTLAWSDPVCNYNSAGALTGNCSVGTGVEAFDGNSTINGFTVSFTGPATIAFAPGTKITIGTGKLGTPTNSITGDAKILQAYPFFRDGDGDGYASGTQIYTSSTASWTGYVRMNAVNGQGTGSHYQVPVTTSTDCYDADPATTNAELAYPGQTNYYYTNRGDGSFDYNCSNGSIEGGWKTTSATGPTVYAQISSQQQPPDNLCINYSFSSTFDTCGDISTASNLCAIARIDTPLKLVKNDFYLSKFIKFILNIVEARPPDSGYPTGWFSGSTCTIGTCLATVTLYNLCH